MNMISYLIKMFKRKKKPYTNNGKICYNTNIVKKRNGGIRVYKATDVAKYVIKYFNNNNAEITNLKLQKLLYYIQGEALSQNSLPMFWDSIQAWKHGPVVPSVYYQYNRFLSYPIEIDISDMLDIALRDKKIINSVLEKHKDIDPWELVGKTHEEEPWKNTYSTENQNNVISIKEIKKYFDSEKRKQKNAREKRRINQPV